VDNLALDTSEEGLPSQEVVVKGVTPMMEQYLAIKGENQDGLLFYRMGDFYELFFEDAIIAAAVLNITLTKRGKHLGKPIPMCGVPVHSHQNYLANLIKRGHKVVVCEQTENPKDTKKRGAKALVRREVVRTITPGTLTEDTLLDGNSNNFLAAISEVHKNYGLAWLDMSTGDFHMQAVSQNTIPAALARINPCELLVSDSLVEREELIVILQSWRDCFSILPMSRFDSANGDLRLQTLFDVKTLDAFGSFSKAELSAGGALIDYVELTQKGQLPRIAPPKRLLEGAAMEIDFATRRNLELVQTLAGERKGSLLSVLDQTLTGAGGRLLIANLSAPLTDAVMINQRLDMVQFFYDNSNLRKKLCGFLKGVPDIERALSRLTLARGGPRDLAAVQHGLASTAHIIRSFESVNAPDGILSILDDFGFWDELVLTLKRALKPDLPLYSRDGGYIAAGFDFDFDKLCELRDKSRRLIAELQDNYVRATGIKQLKLKYNNAIGYFIEVSTRYAESIPIGRESIFIHRQTTKNSVRYTTLELGELEGQIASAADKALATELYLFNKLVAEIKQNAEEIALAASALARLDVSVSLARLAVDQRYCRPRVDDSLCFNISCGRHPVVEQAVVKENSLGRLHGGVASFVANDCNLNDPSQLWLLTGPNMAGKSTFLRQNALITIMAQMGCFVPAEQAHIGVIDRLFSRVGASDDLAQGRSTFMVEMVETAVILTQATDRSFVILDEIGRGTSTFDGLSIAWAVVEYLCEINKSRALFATHYHELTAIASKLDGLSCHTMRVKEWKKNVVFLHEVARGRADKSYGIYVGQLAGLPATVVARAEEVLVTLEDGEPGSVGSRLENELPLLAFDEPFHRELKFKASALEEALDVILPDELSPREALELIYELKKLRE